MRQLIPTFLYPGRSRVGSIATSLELDRTVVMMGEIDWFWGFSLPREARHLHAWRPDAAIFQWWTGSVLHTYLVLALFARLQGTRVIVEFHEVLDTAEQRIPLARAWVRVLGRPFFALADAFVIHSEADRRADQRTLRRRKPSVCRHPPWADRSLRIRRRLSVAPAS